MENKNKLIGLIALIVIGFFVYSSVLEEGAEEQTEEEYEWDTNRPSSQIISPPSGTLHRKDFQIKVLDEDLESGIKEGSGQYLVFSYDSNYKEVSSGWKSRKCNSLQTISVGPEEDCCFEGVDSCWIYVRCQDKAGNWGKCYESELSIKHYSINWTSPHASEIMTEEEDKSKTTIKNKKMASFLYLDKKNQEVPRFLGPQCYNYDFLKNLTPLSSNPCNAFAYHAGLAKNRKDEEVKQVAILRFQLLAITELFLF